MIRLSVSIRKAAFCSLKLLLATKYTVTKKSALFPVKNADFFYFRENSHYESWFLFIIDFSNT